MVSNLNEKFKSKLQTVQNRCIRYCLQLDNRSHIGIKDFEKINWLPFSERFNQYLCSNAFTFLGTLLLYVSMIYVIWSKLSKYEIFCFEAKTSFKKHMLWSKKLSYLAPKVWNSLPTDLKLANSLNNFNHKLKDHFFKKLRNVEENIFAYRRPIRNLNCNIFN